MKKIFLAFVITMGLVNVGCSQTATQSASQADISFVSSTHDFGTIPQGTPVSYVFSFKNTGKEPLVLTSVTPSCGCTTPEWPKEPIKPGATATIKAIFNAAAIGTFNKAITVVSNAKTPSVVLTFKGEVKAPAAQTTAPASAQSAAPKKN